MTCVAPEVEPSLVSRRSDANTTPLQRHTVGLVIGNYVRSTPPHNPAGFHRSVGFGVTVTRTALTPDCVCVGKGGERSRRRCNLLSWWLVDLEEEEKKKRRRLQLWCKGYC